MFEVSRLVLYSVINFLVIFAELINADVHSLQPPLTVDHEALTEEVLLDGNEQVCKYEVHPWMISDPISKIRCDFRYLCLNVSLCEPPG